MKRLIPLFLLLCCTAMHTQAQYIPWQAVQPIRKCVFSDGNTNLYLSVDSMQPGGFTSRFWNYWRFAFVPQAGDVGYYYLDSVEWTGRQMTEHATVDNEFLCANGQIFRIKINKDQVGDTWACYDLPGKAYIRGHVDSVYWGSFLSVSDSIRRIRFQAVDSTGMNMPHFLNNTALRLSKNHGLLDVLWFGDFEKHGGVFSLTGFTNPYTNWPDLTAEKVFNIQPGDVRHVNSENYPSGSSIPTQKTIAVRTCFQRIELNSGQTIVLKDSVWQIQLTYNMAQQKFDTVSSLRIQVDTIHLADYAFLNRLDHEPCVSPVYQSNFYCMHTQLINGKVLPPGLKAKVRSEYYSYDASNQRWPKFSDQNTTVYYLQHGGKPFSFTQGITGGHTANLPLYIKTGGITWGSTGAWDSLSKAVSAWQPRTIRHSVYPNPVSDRMQLQLENPAGAIGQLVLTTLSGQQVEHFTFTGATAEFSVRQLPPGMYLYTVRTADGRSAHGKLCRQ